MKKIILAFIAVSSLCFFSCTKQETLSDNVEYIEVPIKSFINGIELIEETPITKGSETNTDMWAINVVQNENYNYSNYCHGIFDDGTLSTTIKFIKGKRYWVTAVYVTDIKNELGYLAGTQKLDGMPFCVNPTNGLDYISPVNKIVYDGGYVNMDSGFRYPHLYLDKKFYRYSDEWYYPSEDNPLRLEYKLKNMGLKLLFEKEEGYEYDYVNVTFADTWQHNPSPLNKKINLVNGCGEYNIPNVGIGTYEGNAIYLSIGTDDDLKYFFFGTVDLKCGKTCVYSIKLKPQGSDIGVGMVFPEDEMAEEDMGNIE